MHSFLRPSDPKIRPLDSAKTQKNIGKFTAGPSDREGDVTDQAMADRLTDLISKLTRDPWRRQRGFDAELDEASRQIFEASSEEESAAILSAWLARHQPCLFGRIAAKNELLSFCILTEQDLTQDDAHIRSRIQAARTEWTRAGYYGEKSGFVILAAAPVIMIAEPNAALQNLAQRICSLYLLEECPPDQILYDDIFLEGPGRKRSVWRWLTGVNVFAAAGDGRWWQDHRIPAGLGFSVNSVGHLVKSSKLADIEKAIDDLLGVGAEPFAQKAIDDLPKALDFAMRTIGNASNAVSGKATWLLDDPGNLPAACPIQLSKVLAGKNYCEYAGYYHTDITIPSLYFRPNVERTEEIEKLMLDFTYLFHPSTDNPAHITMGEGRRLRGEGAAIKKAKANGTLVTLDDEPRIAAAIRGPI
jgi:hypothetical protein